MGALHVKFWHTKALAAAPACRYADCRHPHASPVDCAAAQGSQTTGSNPEAVLTFRPYNTKIILPHTSTQAPLLGQPNTIYTGKQTLVHSMSSSSLYPKNCALPRRGMQTSLVAPSIMAQASGLCCWYQTLLA